VPPTVPELVNRPIISRDPSTVILASLVSQSVVTIVPVDARSTSAPFFKSML